MSCCVARLPVGLKEAEITHSTGKSAKTMATAATSSRRIRPRRRRRLIEPVRLPIRTRTRACSLPGIVLASDTLGYLLPLPREPELDQREDRHNGEDHNGDGSSIGIIGAAPALKGDAVGIADQDVAVSGGGRRACNRRAALVIAEDHSKVVEVKHKGRDQQRPNADEQQRQRDVPEALP